MSSSPKLMKNIIPLTPFPYLAGFFFPSFEMGYPAEEETQTLDLHDTNLFCGTDNNKDFKMCHIYSIFMHVRFTLISFDNKLHNFGCVFYVLCNFPSYLQKKRK